jgi:hypothetical protein
MMFLRGENILCPGVEILDHNTPEVNIAGRSRVGILRMIHAAAAGS